MARRCVAAQGWSGQGSPFHDPALRDVARPVAARRCAAPFLFSRQGTARRVLAGHGRARPGWRRLDMAPLRPGMTRLFMAGFDSAVAGLGVARLPETGRDVARCGGPGRCTAELPFPTQGKSWPDWTWPGLARLPYSVHGVTRRGAACPDRARQGSPLLFSPGPGTACARHRSARLGFTFPWLGGSRTWCRMARLGHPSRGQAGHGISIQVPAWRSRGAAMLAFPRRCKSRHVLCTASRGKASQRRGPARLPLARLGVRWRGWARRGSTGRGWAWLDIAGLGSPSRGGARYASTRRGKARLILPLARLCGVGPGVAWPDRAWRCLAGQGCSPPRAMLGMAQLSSPHRGSRRRGIGPVRPGSTAQGLAWLPFSTRGAASPARQGRIVQGSAVLGPAPRGQAISRRVLGTAGRGGPPPFLGTARQDGAGSDKARLDFPRLLFPASGQARQLSAGPGIARLPFSRRGTAGRDLARHRNARRGSSPLPLSGQDQTWRCAARLGPGGAGRWPDMASLEAPLIMARVGGKTWQGWSRQRYPRHFVARRLRRDQARRLVSWQGSPRHRVFWLAKTCRGEALLLACKFMHFYSFLNSAQAWSRARSSVVCNSMHRGPGQFFAEKVALFPNRATFLVREGPKSADSSKFVWTSTAPVATLRLCGRS